MSSLFRQLEQKFLANTPVVLIGLPGIGKTAMIKALFRKHKVISYIMTASNRDPSDFGGMPMLSKQEDCFLWQPAAWAKFLKEAGESGHRTAVFIDEANTCAPMTTATLMRVIDEGVVGELALPWDCWRCCAINPTEIATNGSELPPALANRMGHMAVELDRDDFIMNFPTYWGEPPKKVVPEEKWMPARGNVAAFLYVRKAKILDFPKDQPSLQSGPWPSPRTWDLASQILAISSSPEDAASSIGDYIGQGLAMEFITFLRNLDLPDPEKLLGDPTIFKLEKYKNRGDQVFAILSSLHSAVVTKLDQKRFAAFWKILGTVADAGIMDIGAVWAKPLSKLYQVGWTVPAEVNKYAKILTEIGKRGGGE
jgi:hypothetical protein